MRQFYIFTIVFLLFGGVFSVNAQDLIILKDGNTIEAKVMEISPTEIRYIHFDHLDGPTIVVLTENVLSIRYENGRTEIINTVTQPATPDASAETTQTANQLERNPRLNALGLAVGYLGVSNFGFALNGIVSPAPGAFFDFNMGLGFVDFSFNGNVNFNGFVPFRNGGWYGGIGLGGGLYELGDSMTGFFAFNAVTGFLFFNWLNISATLQIEVAPEFEIRIKPMAGYVYRFKPKENTDTNTEEKPEVQKKPKRTSQLKQNSYRNTTYRHWISGEIGFLTQSIMYEYVFTPKFSLNLRGYYIPVSLRSFDLGFNVIPRWYPTARYFFMELGLGYNCFISEYLVNSFISMKEIMEYNSGFSIIPGIGLIFDIGKRGGFFVTTGIRGGVVIGQHGLQPTFLYSIYLGLGYAF